jgi:hypothetical protein
MPDNTGPHVQVATFCERVLQEKDGVISVIRAIDRLALTIGSAAGGPVPSEIPPGLTIQPTLVISLRSDQARGRFTLRIVAQQPDTTLLPEFLADVMFEGEDRGVNVVLPMTLQPQEGLYWFDIRLGNQLLTRVPLRIIYQRLPGAS